MKRLDAALPWILCALAPQIQPSHAEAHALPMGIALAWPEASSAVPWVLTNRGVVFADGQAASLRCNEAFFINTSAYPSFWAQPDYFVIATRYQVLTSSDQGCSLPEANGLPGLAYGGFTVLDDAEQTLLLPTAQHDDKFGGVFASVDHGRTFALRSANAPLEAFTQLVSAAGRIYATGFRLDPVANKVVDYVWAVSDDAARSFTRTSLPRERVVLGVSPTDPKVVFAYETLDSVTGEVAVSQSRDGGATFVERLRLVGRPSFAADPSGSTLWLGAASTAGLWVSHDGGDHFVNTRPELTAITCLAHHAGALHACARHFPIVLGVWSQTGEDAPLQQVLSFSDVTEPVACGSAATDICTSSWSDWTLELLSGPLDGDAGLAVDAGAAPSASADASIGQGGEPSAVRPAAPPPVVDAGSPKAPESADSGCQVRAPAARDTSASRGLLLLTVLASALRLRRRRAR